MTVSFAGQVVVVTGAGGGLGGAYACEVARRGGAVVVNDLGGAVRGGGPGSRELADATVEKIRAEGGKAVANYDSVATAEGGRAIIDAALSTFGRIDAVIANAGTMRYAPFDELTPDDLAALVSVHLGGSWHLAQAAWPHMKAQNYGRLVFTTSSTAMFGSVLMAAYGAAKGAIMGLMHGLAEEGAPLGILCNALMPNAATRMTAGFGDDTLGDNPWMADIGRTFDPAFAAPLATYLASNACTTHHGLYSSLGGRVARVAPAVNTGLRGSREVPLTVEDIAAHWHRIHDDTSGLAIPAHVFDEFRIVAEQAGD